MTNRKKQIKQLSTGDVVETNVVEIDELSSRPTNRSSAQNNQNIGGQTSNSIQFDLSNLIVKDIKFSNGVLYRKNGPLVVCPTISPSGSMYQLEIEELEISIVAFDREELEDTLIEYLIVLWENYAQVDDAKLTKSARRLKQRICSEFEERK